jgi:hypothetical protein
MSYRHGRNWDELVAEFLALQNGRCYLCAEVLDTVNPRGFVMDHDHSCCRYGYSCELCRRGLACPSCNLLIGQGREDPDRLRLIANNLETAKRRLASLRAS